MDSASFPPCNIPSSDPLLKANKDTEKSMVSDQNLDLILVGTQAIQESPAVDKPFTAVSKTAHQREIIPSEKAGDLVASANPFAALASDAASNPDQSSSDDAYEDQESLACPTSFGPMISVWSPPLLVRSSKRVRRGSLQRGLRFPVVIPTPRGGTHQN